MRDSNWTMSDSILSPCTKKVTVQTRKKKKKKNQKKKKLSQIMASGALSPRFTVQLGEVESQADKKVC
jgi:hypothetical protein